jgi:uncharacterized membrane protein YeiB
MAVDSRILAYDLARSLALLGMVAINFWVFMENGEKCPNWLEAVLCIMQGKAAATFVVLAGAGISLLTWPGITIPFVIFVANC